MSDAPLKYIATSDYATLSNDDSLQLVLVIPGNQVISAGATASYSVSGVAGVPGAITQATISHSWAPKQYFSQFFIYTGEGLESGLPAQYSVNIVVFRSSATEITLAAYITNTYGSNLTTEATARTVTAEIRTFIPPFS